MAPCCTASGNAQHPHEHLASVLQLSDEEILNKLPAPIKQRVLRALYLECLQRPYIFRSLSHTSQIGFFDSLLSLGTVEHYMRDIEVVQQGHFVNDLIILVDGAMITHSTVTRSEPQHLKRGSRSYMMRMSRAIPNVVAMRSWSAAMSDSSDSDVGRGREGRHQSLRGLFRNQPRTTSNEAASTAAAVAAQRLGQHARGVLMLAAAQQAAGVVEVQRQEKQFDVRADLEIQLGPGSVLGEIAFMTHTKSAVVRCLQSPNIPLLSRVPESVCAFLSLRRANLVMHICLSRTFTPDSSRLCSSQCSCIRVLQNCHDPPCDCTRRNLRLCTCKTIHILTPCIIGTHFASSPQQFPICRYWLGTKADEEQTGTPEVRMQSIRTCNLCRVLRLSRSALEQLDSAFPGCIHTMLKSVANQAQLAFKTLSGMLDDYTPGPAGSRHGLLAPSLWDVPEVPLGEKREGGALKEPGAKVEYAAVLKGSEHQRADALVEAQDPAATPLHGAVLREEGMGRAGEDGAAQLPLHRAQGDEASAVEAYGSGAPTEAPVFPPRSGAGGSPGSMNGSHAMAPPPLEQTPPLQDDTAGCEMAEAALTLAAGAGHLEATGPPNSEEDAASAAAYPVSTTLRWWGGRRQLPPPAKAHAVSEGADDRMEQRHCSSSAFVSGGHTAGSRGHEGAAPLPITMSQGATGGELPVLVSTGGDVHVPIASDSFRLSLV
jgi:hypothetical protein